MPDNLSPEDRRKTMQAVKGSNTSLERAVEAAFLERGWVCQRNAGPVRQLSRTLLGFVFAFRHRGEPTEQEQSEH